MLKHRQNFRFQTFPGAYGTHLDFGGQNLGSPPLNSCNHAHTWRIYFGLALSMLDTIETLTSFSSVASEAKMEIILNLIWYVVYFWKDKTSKYFFNDALLHFSNRQLLHRPFDFFVQLSCTIIPYIICRLIQEVVIICKKNCVNNWNRMVKTFSLYDVSLQRKSYYDFHLYFDFLIIVLNSTCTHQSPLNV